MQERRKEKQVSLVLKKSKDLKGICYKKEYTFGSFVIDVTINPDESMDIDAYDVSDKEILIKAVDDHPATLYVEHVIMQDSERIISLSKKLVEASKLLDIINMERKRLGDKEER